jgi:hypothetical protein
MSALNNAGNLFFFKFFVGRFSIFQVTYTSLVPGFYFRCK